MAQCTEYTTTHIFTQNITYKSTVLQKTKHAMTVNFAFNFHHMRRTS